ncbi:hypothetical protein SAMN05216249_11427 [Acetitomaculum ruminis DSM 5522]|uniref:Uncharacterized protein n=1 Tax=Acetitomaculum ruminis DSM 5522 TaxID=1120918 RepID=A0A1I0ZAY7_9FIRM|nr:hypothetical protein [Acetitomaculum ruminis]SFB22919.1 hypothetical protein SAMN05216249_11427 [Acetitomaculum ruminis DSM 5522]
MKLKVEVDRNAPWKPIFQKDTVWEKVSQWINLEPNLEFYIFNDVTKVTCKGFDELARILNSNDDIHNYVLSTSFNMTSNEDGNKFDKIVYIDSRGKMHFGRELLDNYVVGICYDVLGGDKFLRELDLHATKVFYSLDSAIDCEKKLNELKESLNKMIKDKMKEKAEAVARITLKFLERVISCKEIEIWREVSHPDRIKKAILDDEENNELYFFNGAFKNTYFYMNGYVGNKKKGV